MQRPYRSTDRKSRAKPLPKSKVCRSCKEEKCLRAFYVGSPTKRWPKGQPTQWCKKCHLKKLKARRYDRTEEERVEYLASKATYSLNKKMEEFGLVASDIPERCEVCKETSDRAMCIDHDHVTGIFRGFLCHHCNSALGFAKDNPKILKGLVKYLKENRNDTT